MSLAIIADSCLLCIISTKWLCYYLVEDKYLSDQYFNISIPLISYQAPPYSLCVKLAEHLFIVIVSL